MTKGQVISLAQAAGDANRLVAAADKKPARPLLETAARDLARLNPQDPAAFAALTELIAEGLKADRVRLLLTSDKSHFSLRSIDWFDARSKTHSTGSLEVLPETEAAALLSYLFDQLLVCSGDSAASAPIAKLQLGGLLSASTKAFALRAIHCEGRVQGLLLIETDDTRTWELDQRLFLSAGAESAAKLLLSPIFSRASLSTRFRIELEKLSSRLTASSALSVEKSFAAEINDILKDIAGFLDADRGFIYSVSADEQTSTGAFSWTSEAASGSPRMPHTVSLDDYPWSIGLLKSGKTVIVQSVEELPPEAASDAAHWRSRGISSFLCAPLTFDAALVGIFGVSLRGTARRWTEEEARFLEFVAVRIGDVLARRKAEEKVRQNEDRLHLMIKESPVAVAMFDRDLRLIMASDCWFADFNLDAADSIGKTYDELAPDIPNRWKRVHREALAGVIRHCDEDALTRPDGSVDWLRWEIRPWHNRSGRIGGIVVFREWITERKKTEEALRLYQFAMDRCADGVFWFLPDGSISYVNDAACALLGCSSGELLKKSVFELMPGMSKEEWARHWQEHRAASSLSSELLFQTKEGSPVPIEANENYFEFNGKEFICCFARDNSERRRHAQEREHLAESLQQQQKFLRQVIDLNPNFIFAKDLAGRYTLVNKASADRYGLKVEDMLGKTDLDLPQPEAESRRFRKEDMEVARFRRPAFIPEDVVHIGERKVWLQTEKLPIVDESGEVTQVLGVATDISDRKLAEESRITLEHRIQHTQKLESLGVLAGGIAHDFNNLLMGILGNAGLVLMQLSPSSPTHKRVERIKTAAERAADLTNQLLAYSGKGKFIVEPINLSMLVHEMVSLLETVISKKCSIICQFADHIPYVEADATQVRQVVMNLITNASEALEDKSGTIMVETGSMYADSDFLSTIYLNDHLVPGEYAYLEVIDTGKGMSKETLGKIFDPFFTTKFAGRGLGLAGVLGIVRSHRGALKVESTLGRGTTFRALFPTVKNRIVEPAGGESRQQPGPGGSQGLFLVVDDEDLTLSVAEEILAEEGFDVITAVDGQQGIDLYREHQGKLVGVLLDVTMPIVDGEEALREMQQINPGIPIILSSGFSEQEAVRRVHGKPIAGFIQKPYLPSALIAKIKTVMG